MPHDDHLQAIAAFRRRIVGLRMLDAFLLLGAAWGFAWGVGVIVLRVMADVPRPWLMFGAVGLVGVLAAAWWIAMRGRPDAAAVRALCDDRSGAGGLMMSEAEGPLGGWRDRLPRAVLPAVRWRFTNGGPAAFAAAAVFVAAALLVPGYFVRAKLPPDPTAFADTTRLETQVEVLEEEAVLEEQEADELRNRLDQVREEAKGQDPVKTWEALDHLADQLEQEAQDAAEAAIRETETLTAAEALAEALQQEPQPLSEEQLAGAMGALAEMAEQAAAENAAVDAALSEALKEALESGALTKEQLEALAEALREGKRDLAEAMQNLAEAKLIEKRMVAQGEAAGEGGEGGEGSGGDGEGLAEFLAANMGESGDAKKLAQSWCKGGISRGRGDAELTWTAKASEAEGVDFQPEALPPAELEAMRESRRVGLSAATPERDAEAAAAVAGSLADTASTGGSATRQVVLPRHRKTMERYFDRGSEASE